MNNRLCIFPSLNLPFPLISSCLMEQPYTLKNTKTGSISYDNHPLPCMIAIFYLPLYKINKVMGYRLWGIGYRMGYGWF